MIYREGLSLDGDAQEADRREGKDTEGTAAAEVDEEASIERRDVPESFRT